MILQKNPDFRRFWLGQLISQLGDRVHTLAVIWLVYSWTNSGSTVGLVLIASTLPAFIVSPIAGNILDKYDRKRIMILCDLFRSALVLTLFVLAFLDLLNLTIILAATTLISLGAAFFNPATMSLMPSVVKQNELVHANAFFQLSVNASSAVGFMIGSGLIATIGIPAAFAINGISFLFSAYFLTLITYKQDTVPKQNSFWKDFSEGWTVTKGIPLIRKLLGPIIVINFFFSSLFVLIPVFAEGVFNKGSAGLGIMMSSFTLGMFAGALMLSGKGLRIRISYLVVSNLFFIGMAFMIMGVFKQYYLFIMMLFLVGIALNLSNIALMALFQMIVPNEIRGKVFGLLTSASVSSQPISYGLMGLITDIVSPSAILISCSIALFLTAIWLWTIKGMDNITSSQST
jgi:MFS family permease